MRIIEIIGVLLLLGALYHWMTGGGEDKGARKVETVQKVYEESLEKLGWAEEKLEKEYEKYNE